MRDQSSFAAWYFIEHAEIGDLNINCTIALTSSILTSPYGAQTPTPEPRSGLFSRAIGTAGFQLINVNNVPLQLSGWSTETRLIGRKALVGVLTRHYVGQAIGEAHKVWHFSFPVLALTSGDLPCAFNPGAF